MTPGSVVCAFVGAVMCFGFILLQEDPLCVRTGQFSVLVCDVGVWACALCFQHLLA